MIWLDIQYSSNHEVSSTGLIRNKKSGRILKHWLVNGYPTIRFKLRGKNYLIHRLVCESFIKLEPGKDIVNHKNGITTDNRVENLEWCDRSYNFYHAVEIGLCDGKANNIGHTRSIGSKNAYAKVTEADVVKIRELKKNGLTLKQIGGIFNIHPATVGYIVQRKTWRHVE